MYTQFKHRLTQSTNNVPLNTKYIILETVLPSDHLTATSKIEPNYNQIQFTTKPLKKL